MQQWEYLTIKLQPIETKLAFGKKDEWDDKFFTQQINQYASQGWELVSTFTTHTVRGYGSATNGVFAIFKKSKDQNSTTTV